MRDLTLMQFQLNDRKFRQSLVGIDVLNALCAVDLTVESSRGRFVWITDRFSDPETSTTGTNHKLQFCWKQRMAEKKKL